MKTFTITLTQVEADHILRALAERHSQLVNLSTSARFANERADAAMRADEVDELSARIARATELPQYLRR